MQRQTAMHSWQVQALKCSGTVDSDCIAASGICSIRVSEAKTGRVSAETASHTASL